MEGLAGYSLTHSLARPPTHPSKRTQSLIHSLTHRHSITRSLAHPSTNLLIHPLVNLPTCPNSLTRLLARSLTHSLIRSPTNSLIVQSRAHSFTAHLPICSPAPPLTRSSAYSLIHPCFSKFHEAAVTFLIWLSLIFPVSLTSGRCKDKRVELLMFIHSKHSLKSIFGKQADVSSGCQP